MLYARGLQDGSCGCSRGVLLETVPHRFAPSMNYSTATTGSHAEEDLSLKVTCCESPFSRHDDGAARFKHCPGDALLPAFKLRH